MNVIVSQAVELALGESYLLVRPVQCMAFLQWSFPCGFSRGLAVFARDGYVMVDIVFALARCPALLSAQSTLEVACFAGLVDAMESLVCAVCAVADGKFFDSKVNTNARTVIFGLWWLDMVLVGEAQIPVLAVEADVRVQVMFTVAQSW